MSTSLRLAVIALMLISAVALGMIGLQIARPVAPVVQQEASAPAPILDAYLVAARGLSAGTLARDEDFTTASAPPGQVPADAILDSPSARAGLRGALIRTYIDAGKQISLGDVLRPRDRGFLASVLQPGSRAISMGVDHVTGVAGLIWPGDRVDVILTQQLQKESAQHRVLSETIMANVRVIAIDQEIVQGAPPDSSAAGKPAHTATLEVSPEQAEKLTVALQLGQLALAIRAAADAPTGASPQGVTSTFGSDVSPALANSDQVLGQSMQLIEGDKRNEVTFR